MKIGFAAFLSLVTLIPSTPVRSNSVPSKVHPPKPREATECQLPAGWEAVVNRKSQFVVFGELHGTQQAPAFVGDVACALSAQGERVLVAVEHPSKENPAFQAAWKVPDARFPEAIKQAGWADRDDGVGSEAMLSLLVRLHQLAQRVRKSTSSRSMANGTMSKPTGFLICPGRGRTTLHKPRISGSQPPPIVTITCSFWSAMFMPVNVRSVTLA